MAHSNSRLPPHLASVLESINASSMVPGDDLDLFFHCWIRPHCPACLSASNPYPCSWCATSQTCVPNTIYPYPFGILSPLQSAEICPLAWRERWELRARPFSCRCSSMTFVSVVVAVLATLVGLSLIWTAVRLGRWAGRKWRGRKQGWWRVSRWVPAWMVAWRRGPRKDASTATGARGGMDTGGGGAAATDETTPLLA
ncbi:uncharacterized protein PV07_03006 [Cladophialophora immunda]|uniref:PSI domain-containing protein n=1 Tax=Cladophialophora immunda TaxID=569365 RepID=A0A0D2D6K8_9EURO|nr:uncharacterized protein PV07_03006 [Cladophialophora immunda]KIW31349.1 hypothetical protein PV07_03006 [Cladophialophora immunda]